MAKTKERKFSKEDQKIVDILVMSVQENFRTFGGNKTSSWGNPITAALAGTPPAFASGVIVEDVVKHILTRFAL